MIIFPAMDLLDGNVVKLEAKHHRDRERLYGSPGEVGAKWLAFGPHWIHVIDLNATLGRGAPNDFVLDELLPLAAEAGANVQWGGGVRDTPSLERVLSDRNGHSVRHVIVGTRAVGDRDWLAEQSARFPGKIMVAVDADGRRILVKGWQEATELDAVEFVRGCADLPLAGFLYTNVKVEGRGAGVDWAPISDVVSASPHPVVVSGGVTTLEEISRLRDLGAWGAVVGNALYSGNIDLATALSTAREAPAC